MTNISQTVSCQIAQQPKMSPNRIKDVIWGAKKRIVKANRYEDREFLQHVYMLALSVQALQKKSSTDYPERFDIDTPPCIHVIEKTRLENALFDAYTSAKRHGNATIVTYDPKSRTLSHSLYDGKPMTWLDVHVCPPYSDTDGETFKACNEIEKADWYSGFKII